ncbi:MAG: DNA polymerase III subunit alpha [Firmicutes bacterium]|nr:DNA polymerase III subunit alpha [Bacillota bacterium]
MTTKTGGFVHLHNHTEYSLLDGAAKIKELVAAAVEMKMPAMAITDHGTMYGVVDFYKAAHKAGIKPILGCEVYVAPESRFVKEGSREDNLYHLVLLAENNQGYKNLMELVTLSNREGFYYKPRVDRELLRKHSQGLICLSGCLGGQIPTLLMRGNTEGARELAREFRDIFGPENFYLELQDHQMLEQKEVNEALAAMSKELDIPLVATNDLHYLRREDAEAHDILLCIQTAKQVDDENRMRFPNDEFYLKSPLEMSKLFAWCPEAVENTLKIAERCHVELDFETMHMPDYPVPEGHNPDTWLRHLCEEQLTWRYPEPTEEVRERMEFELSVIKRMGYSGYFLIVWDFVDFARRNNILVGPGRGSGAGSIVAYILGITDIDPLPYKLLFERFLNPERVSMPDFDIDFCYERRGEVMEYVMHKYGRERVAQIITFGTMAARAVVRDVGRAMGFSFAETDRIAKLIPEELKMTIDKALEAQPELRTLVKEDERVAKLIDIARKLEGLARHASMHAAGVVIAKEELVNYVPLQGNDEEGLVTQFPMTTLEELGLLKMDFLGLRTLTIINHSVQNIRQTRGIDVDIANIPLDDLATYKLLCDANTLGVFQLESDGMRKVMTELKPSTFEDIVALVALYRPGPMEQIPAFIASKHGETPVKYPHPKLEELLKETYGIMIYQEQIMLAAAELAGFSLGQADLLRRAMGKKKLDVMKEQRKIFIQGCKDKNGLTEKQAGDIYDLIVKFADYGFNKSHSAAYALVAYQTAWLKANYPIEFMAAMLGGAMGNSDKVAFYIDHCRRLGIEVLPPDINESGVSFTVVEDKIRFGLGAVKNVGAAAVEQMLEEREQGGDFTSLSDFCERMNGRCNKRMLEYMIKGGAFDGLPGHRGQKLAALEDVLARAARIHKQKISGQMDIFSLIEDDGPAAEALPPVEPLSRDAILTAEKEALGLYITGHPLEEYLELLDSLNVLPISGLNADTHDGKEVTVAGIVTARRTIITRRGSPMSFVTLEDQFGSVELIFFEEMLRTCGELLKEKGPLLVRGRAEFQTQDQPKLMPASVTRLQAPNGTHKLYLKFEDRENEDLLNRVFYALAQFPGDTAVYLYLPEINRTRLLDQFPVDPCENLIRQLEELLGKSCVVLKKVKQAAGGE